MRGLTGKRAIVTGGGSGIGRATVLRLVAEGCEVGIFDIDESGAEATAALAGGQAKAYRTDIARSRGGKNNPSPRSNATWDRPTCLQMSQAGSSR